MSAAWAVDGHLRVNDTVGIPVGEISFRASRAGGPGGQHVNTSSTRVELLWSVAETGALTDEQRARVMRKLASRLNAEGVLQVAASEYRSQQRNRQAAAERLAELLRGALAVPRPRKKTRPPRAAREARLTAKKQRAQTKRMRGPVSPDE